ncbi:MFS transporter [Ectothiorhodospiraceae bacterium WFHF3C12]|nr:MFS transporter [Ectothiorhodospiraceae bacterium WFHF3C12]
METEQRSGAAMTGALTTAVVLRIFLPFAAGYYLSYVYRAVNAVIAPNLVADAGLSASDLGLLTSAYFLAFAVLQLPIGVLLDRFGPRRVEAIMLLFAAAGSVIFAMADDLAGLGLGRALIGAGVSCCMMAAFKAFVLWFRPHQLPAINGFLLTAGALGAISATAPVEWLVALTDWRFLFAALGVFGILIAAAVHFIVPEHPERPEHVTMRDQLSGLAEIFRDRFFWRVAPVAAVCQGGGLAIQGLWMGPWLRDVAGFTRPEVANHLLITALALGVGFFTMGLMTERLSRLGVRPVSVAGAGMTIYVAAVALIASGWTLWLPVLLAAFGFLASTGTLSYALMSQHFSRHLAGRANTALNLLVFVAAFAAQWLIGVVLLPWEDPATHAYALPGYQVAFGGLAAVQLGTLAWFFISGRRAPG